MNIKMPLHTDGTEYRHQRPLGDKHHSIFDATCACIAHVPDSTTAALFIRAVNAHDDLLEACEAAEEALDSASCTFGLCPGPDVPPVDMATCSVCRGLQTIRAAIAKAKPPEATP